MSRSSYLPLLCLLAGIGIAPAQSQARVFGVVRPGPGGFVLEGPPVRVSSGDVDLGVLVGQVADLRGVLVPGSQPPLVDVQSATRSTAAFRVQGAAAPGNTLTFRVDHPGARRYYVFLSGATDFVPLEPFLSIVHGTLLLHLPTTVTVFGGAMIDSWQQQLPLPNDPNLIGLVVHFQAATVSPDAGGASITYINAATVTIQ